jgi:integrase/recombinase XerD
MTTKRRTKSAIEQVRADETNEFSLELQMVFKAYLDDCVVRNISKKTIDVYITYLKTYFRFCMSQGLDPFNIDEYGLMAFIRYLREDRENCQKSVTNHFCALSSFHQYLLFTRKIEADPIPIVSKRYLRSYKSEGKRSEKKLLSVEEMARLISMVDNVRDRAILLVLAKTGMRRNELITLDVSDAELKDGRITLKPTNKRSNRVLFIDQECIKALEAWLRSRKAQDLGSKPLFIGRRGRRIHRCDVYSTVVRWATLAGYHDPTSKDRSDHLGPHCFRHWFTTHLIRKGMSRDYVKELRGDARKEAIDLYNHIDKEDLKRDYLKRIPILYRHIKEEKERGQV